MSGWWGFQERWVEDPRDSLVSLVDLGWGLWNPNSTTIRCAIHLTFLAYWPVNIVELL